MGEAVKKRQKVGSNYIDNNEFSTALVEYKRAAKLAKKEKLPKPPIPDYLGKCFLDIAEHLSYSPRFISYSYRDEMVSDGVENCLMYLENFNPNAISKNKKGNNFGKKTKGPFPYFTMIIYYAFLRRIKKERKQQYVKAKSVELSNLINELTPEDIETLGKDINVKYTNTNDPYTNITAFIANFEEAIRTEKAKKKAKKSQAKEKNA